MQNRGGQVYKEHDPTSYPFTKKRKKLAKKLTSEHINIKQYLIYQEINYENQRHIDHNIVLIFPSYKQKDERKWPKVALVEV